MKLLKKGFIALAAAAMLAGGVFSLSGCNFDANQNQSGSQQGGSQQGGNQDTDDDDTDDSDSSDTSAISSVEFAKNLVIGWNLGNAFDASSCDNWAYSAGLNMEYSWLPHKQATSQKLIKTVKNTGFKTIRIPVSWHNHMSKTDSGYVIDSKWMNRVKTVVDWALAENMYVIINIHHDNLTESEIAANPGFCLSTDAEIQKTSKAFIEKVWNQISATFKDYDEHLIFEVLNEPRCVGTNMEWGFWGENSSKAETYCDIITDYEQTGLNAIRASGGKNATRYVMVPGYAASPDYIDYYTMPKDTASDKLLLSTHAYTPSNFALGGNVTDYDKNKDNIESAISFLFNNLKKDFINKGIGVVMGEASASDKENTTSREKWAAFYFAKAKAAGIPVVLWDNEVVVAELSADGKKNYDEGNNGENHGYFNRVTCTQYFPTIVNIMISAAGSAAEEPSDDDTDDSAEKIYNISGSVELTLKANPSSTTNPAACKLALSTSNEGAESSPTFTFTSFAVKKGETVVSKTVTTGTLDANPPYGWQWVGEVMNGTNLVSGDTVTVTFEGTSNVLCNSLTALFVDNTEDAGWWNELSDRANVNWSCTEAAK